MTYELDPNLKPSPVDPRDHIAKLPPFVGTLPMSVDLIPHVTEVEDQQQFNSCTANAGCSALELMYNANGKPMDLSRFFLYYYTRYLGGIRGDNGAYPRDIGRALRNYGVCPEPLWDYLPELVDVEPNDTAKTEAQRLRIVSYEQLIGDRLLQTKNAVAQGIPVLLMIEVHQGFYSLTGDWKTHNWNTVTGENNSMLGYHEVLVIGYDDVAERLLVQNSWGPRWGDGGFFGIPYSKVMTPMYKEMWIVHPNYEFDNPILVLPDPEKAPPLSTEEKNNLSVALKVLVIAAMVLLGLYIAL